MHFLHTRNCFRPLDLAALLFGGIFLDTPLVPILENPIGTLVAFCIDGIAKVEEHPLRLRSLKELRKRNTTLLSLPHHLHQVGLHCPVMQNGCDQTPSGHGTFVQSVRELSSELIRGLHLRELLEPSIFSQLPMIIGLHQRFHVRLARRIVPELWILLSQEKVWIFARIVSFTPKLFRQPSRVVVFGIVLRVAPILELLSCVAAILS
mmetsp:Transcript_21059/g.49462  ORF Transcript_21059/g.49462 Transcript_21059/m.49462 type:complete len:207 (-) Transcript_21059:321-941(-)